MQLPVPPLFFWSRVSSVFRSVSAPASIWLNTDAIASEMPSAAPLLFTAFGNQYWNYRIDQPTAALPLQIFTYAISPFDEWHRQAWAGALVLIVLIVVSVSAVRIAASRGMLKGAN